MGLFTPPQKQTAGADRARRGHAVAMAVAATYPALRTKIAAPFLDGLEQVVCGIGHLHGGFGVATTPTRTTLGASGPTPVAPAASVARWWSRVHPVVFGEAG
jgi:hypothetical protein